MQRAGAVGDQVRGVVEDLLAQVRRIELLDRSYTIAASAFVALLPLVIALAGLVSGGGEMTTLGTGVITRLRLDGAAADAVRLLFTGGSPGFYPLGLLVVLYSAFSLSRRVGRAYAAVWEVPGLTLRQQWRGLVWVLLQVAVVLSVGWLRELAVEFGTLAAIGFYTASVVIWTAAEVLAQQLLTVGRVAWRRLVLAGVLVGVGRLGVALWVLVYLAPSLTRQAEQYGPIGVVFSVFTLLFVIAVVMLLGTLLAAVLTRPAEPVSAGQPASA